MAKSGAGIYISDQSAVIFGINSSLKFINNSGDNEDAAIFLSRYTMALFDHNSVVIFNDNSADYGIIYSKEKSKVIFQGTCQVTFNRNTALQYGAAIYSSDNSHITFTENMPW